MDSLLGSTMPLPDLVPDVQDFDHAVEEVFKRFESRTSRKKSRVLDSQGGVTLFLRRWATAPTFEAATSLVKRFELQDDVGDLSKLKDKYKKVDDVFDKITSVLSSSVTGPLNRASKLTKLGGSYTVGWNGRQFGLMFYADPEEVEKLKDHYRKEKSAYTQNENTSSVRCIRDALHDLRRVDIEFGGERNLILMEHAYDGLTRCGIENKDIQLAIQNYTSHPEVSKLYLYGPSGRGSNLGAVTDLINLLHSHLQELELSSKVEGHVVFAGVVYTPVDSAVKEVLAYDLPENMDGVDICREKDIDPKKDITEQKYCVYESKKGGGKGRLRGRFPTKKKALQHKVMMINRYWQGSGKNRKDKPSNK